MSNLSKPREAALKALVAVDKDGAYLNMALRDILASSDMEQRDKALATTLAMGVVKNSIYLDNIIANLSTVKLKKLSVWIHNILRIGVFSLRFLDRIPESATVNECVKLSRRYGHKASSGFVNAILRKASSSGDFLPGEKMSAEYISIKYSIPLWLTESWMKEGYGEEFFRGINEEPPVTVRLNTLKCNSLPEDFEKVEALPHGYNYTGGGSIESNELFRNGSVTVQDGASQIAVNALDVRKDMRVLDLCSAPGGKTAYMAQLMENSGEIVSCDIHPHKIDVIKNNLGRQGVTNAVAMLNDATVLNGEFENGFDRVLADVPCSGLGVIRRKPDIRLNKSELSNEELVKIQRKILSNAARYVKKGGKLMYSTCTVNRAENEAAVEEFVKNNEEYVLLEKRQLLPHTDNTDGFFYAVLERK